jgi:hypothetical protein
MGTTRSGIAVRTLVGHRQIGLGAKCLASLSLFSQEPVHVIVHEDGSVTEEDKEDFCAQVPDCSFVMKKDVDPQMNDFLDKYPACKNLRNTLVLGQKLFDIQVLGEEENLAYADSDVLFLRPFSDLFQMPSDPNAGGVFMRDRIQGYCLRSTQLLLTPGLKLADRMNSGLFYFRRAAFDWDLLEWFLSHDRFEAHPFWKEQTAWSVLAAATRSWMWSEKQVRVIASERDFDGDLVAAHFVSMYRSLLDKAPAHSSRTASLTKIHSVPGGECTSFKLLLDELMRKGQSMGLVSKEQRVFD